MNVIELLEEIEIFDAALLDAEGLGSLVFRFLINMIVAYIIIAKIYSPINKDKEYLFTFFIFNVVVFFVVSLLSDVKIKTGVAFSLFAIFSILRYRTEQIPIKEMTFLFLSITIAVINALIGDKISMAEMLFTNLAIIFTTYFMERMWLESYYSYKVITYEKIDLIKPENEADLKKDLELRTGLTIHSIEVEEINFLRDTAKIKVYYYQNVKH